MQGCWDERSGTCCLCPAIDRGSGLVSSKCSSAAKQALEPGIPHVPEVAPTWLPRNRARWVVLIAATTPN